jgi:3D (Asp-Asp-Asp) domain-containing protein
MKTLKYWTLLWALAFIVISGRTMASSIKLRVTNYQPTKKQCGNTRGITAAGHKAQEGFCAADWRHYPPGTIIKLDSGEYLIVADTGRKVKGRYHVDRFNPRRRPYPTTSRGSIVHRPRTRQAYKAVKEAKIIRYQLILRKKQNNARVLPFTYPQ